MSLTYGLTVEADTNGTYVVDIPVFQGLHTVADTEADIGGEAIEAVIGAIHRCIEARRPIPLPEHTDGEERTVTLSALQQVKVLLWNELLGQRLRKTGLSEMMDVHMPQIDRLFDLDKATTLASVEAAAKALGKRVDVRLD